MLTNGEKYKLIRSVKKNSGIPSKWMFEGKDEDGNEMIDSIQVKLFDSPKNESFDENELGKIVLISDSPSNPQEAQKIIENSRFVCTGKLSLYDNYGVTMESWLIRNMNIDHYECCSSLDGEYCGIPIYLYFNYTSMLRLF